MVNKSMFSDEEKDKSHQETLKMAEDQARESKDYSDQIKKNKANANVVTEPRLWSDKDLAESEKGASDARNNLNTLRYAEHR